MLKSTSLFATLLFSCVTLGQSPSPATPEMQAQNPTNYAPLQNALTSQNWREANRLTSTLILELAGTQQQGYLKARDTQNLACQDLRTIDRLWVQNSNGHFGLTTQAQIWRQLQGKTYEDSLRFEQQVGWNRQQPLFSLESSPKGHLPLRPARSEGIMNAWGGWWIEAMSSRLSRCGIR